MSCKKIELYRNPAKAKIAGVCAGIANYFGWETWLVRILVVSAVLFGMLFVIPAYVAAWFILDKSPEKAEVIRPENNANSFDTNARKNQHSDDLVNESIKVKARVWQSGELPKQALYDIGRKFNALEEELRLIEKHVTSEEFRVSRDINNL